MQRKRGYTASQRRWSLVTDGALVLECPRSGENLFCGRARRWRSDGLLETSQRASHSAGSHQRLLNGQGRHLPKKSTHNPFWEIVRNLDKKMSKHILCYSERSCDSFALLPIVPNRKPPRLSPSLSCRTPVAFVFSANEGKKKKAITMRRLSEKRQNGATHGIVR
ncbi:hypothetical protein CPB86DRAFT_38167 [Serendipita vermifera]|nr:hypothetical protein CPB86DRAFT_38167 [Serendipita vermifera]